MFWLANAGSLAVAYLCGSLPTGYLAGRLVKGIDIRKHGSGSTGATNVLRVVGKWSALVVIVLDVLKGVAAVVFTGWCVSWLYGLLPATPPLALQSWPPWAICLAGLAALLGHSRSVWLGFTGGKSVATGLGVLLAMSWPVGVGGLAVFGVAVAVSRTVSLGSILAALAAIVLVCGLPHPLAYRLMVIAGGAFVILRHRANIQRLLAGTEPRVGQGMAES